MIRLSIIIPFYNVEKYIAECLDSVYNQDIPEDEYEVICVNDASPDNSRDIVLEYQKKHSNLILVEHEVNKKLGAARNTGRKIAQGKYIWNVDSDDMIVPNCLGHLLGICEQNCIDIFIFDRLYNNGGIIEYDKKDWQDITGPNSGVEIWNSVTNKMIFPAWNKIFRKGFLDDNNIYSPEINMGEDVPYSVKAIITAQKVYYTSAKYYVFRENGDSLTRTMRKKPSPKTVYENSFVCGKKMNDVLKTIPSKEKNIIKDVKNVEVYVLLTCSAFLKDMTRGDVREFRNMCRKNFRSNLFVMKVLGRRKFIKYCLFVIGCANM